MKAILISIKPKWAERIYNGTKTLELRKRMPKIPVGTVCLIYESYPVHMVTGYFIYAGAYRFRVDDPSWHLLAAANIVLLAFQWYYSGRTYGYAWTIDQPTKFDKPIELSDLEVKRAPQSYQFTNIPDELIKIQ